MRHPLPPALALTVLAPALVAAAPRAIPLPGASADGVRMDYILYDREHHRVWIPAGNTGAVDVIDTASGSVTSIGGFATREIERDGTKRTVGPSSVTQGDGVMYVGNRGNDTVCAIDATTLKKGACVFLPSMPDGLAYVAATKEVWVTAPRDNALLILRAKDPARPELAATVKLPAAPEGFAVDDARGLFFTNLEDTDRTLTVDLTTRKVRDTWKPDCGKEGPRGLALDHARGLLMVACTDRVKVLDAEKGTVRASMPTGDGLDEIAYLAPRGELYAASARAGKLVVFRVEDGGRLTRIGETATVAGARNAVVTEDGTAYLTDAKAGAILVIDRASVH